jgi:uncharacterized protein (DUF2384 family)
MDKYNPNIMRDIFNAAVAVHDGDEHKARRWLNTANEEFGDYTPLQTCKPYEGAQKVLTHLEQKLSQKNNP